MLPDKLTQIKVVDQLPPPIPLLKSTFLRSEKFKSFVRLQHQPITHLDQTPESNPLGIPSKLSNIQYPFKRISDILLKQDKVLYNIMDKRQSVSEETFGVQYYGDHIETNREQANFGKHENSPVKFESRFECGNLTLAYENEPNHFLLVVRPDYNTTSFCQWFYFQAKNTSSEELDIKFSIINMTKSSSLFSQGMKIMTLSSLNSKWERGGENICYSQNNLRRFNGSLPYYTLSWSLKIKSHQSILMAYSQPYSYTRLNLDLDRFEQSKYVKRSILSRSILDNRIDVLSISDGKENRTKSIVIVTARCHPVETVSSYVMKGIFEFLISEAPEAQLLRAKFVFKLIPMVNPDGVIHGNSRCTMAGVDPNRRWTKPITQILDLKKFILKQKERLVMYVDLHGHSKKKNIFTYGCNDRSKPYASRQLPFIFSKLFDAFSFKDCNFRVNKYKEGTARITLWKTLKLHNIFTLESSFCSSEKSNLHLDQEGYKTTGIMLCKAINVCLSNHFVSDNSTEASFKDMKLMFTEEMENCPEILRIGMDESDSSESEEEHIVNYPQDREVKRLKQNTSMIHSRLKSNPSSQINSRYKQDLANTQSNSLLSDIRHKKNRISSVSLQKQLKTGRSLIECKQRTMEHRKQQDEKDMYRLNFKVKNHSRNLIRIKHPIKSLTPRSFLSGKIINFDFDAKLEREKERDRDDYLRRNQEGSNPHRAEHNQYEGMLNTLRKNNFKLFADSKLKTKQDPKRSTLYRRNNVLSRLQLFLKKVVDK